MEAARINNDCAGCHQHGRPPNRRPREHGIANRGTDGSGCYQIQNILSSRVPVENYFPVETNLDDPFVHFDCESTDALVDRQAKRVRCADGSVPRGLFDVRAALSASDARAEKLCRARRYVFLHLDETGRQAFSPGFEECGVAP
jgi:hypothetical protein